MNLPLRGLFVVCLFFSVNDFFTAAEKLTNPFDIINYLKEFNHVGTYEKDGQTFKKQYVMIVAVKHGHGVERAPVGEYEASLSTANEKTQKIIHRNYKDQLVFRSQKSKKIHSEVKLEHALQQSNEFKNLAQNGADVYYYSVNSPCEDCVDVIKHTLFKEDFKQMNVFLSFDQKFEARNKNKWENDRAFNDAEDARKNLKREKNFVWSDSSKQDEFWAEIKAENIATKKTLDQEANTVFTKLNRETRTRKGHKIPPFGIKINLIQEESKQIVGTEEKSMKTIFRPKDLLQELNKISEELRNPQMPSDMQTTQADSDAAEEEMSTSPKRPRCASPTRKKRTTPCSLSAVDYESATVSKNKITMDAYYDDGTNTRKETIEIDIKNNPALRKFQQTISEMDKRLSSEVESTVPSKRRYKATKTFGRTMGAYGVFMGFVGTINAIEEQNSKEAVVSSALTTNGVVSLVDGSKGAKRLLQKYAVKGLGKAAAKNLAKCIGKTLPVVGVAFDLYSIAEDVRSLKTAIEEDDTKMIILHSVHLALDTVSLALSFAGPQMTPLDIALSLLSMAIDSYYLSIWDELEKAQGKDWNEKVKAVFVGLAKGWANLVTGGLLFQIEQHEELIKNHNQLKAQIESLGNPQTYYGITIDRNQDKTLDFTNGSNSIYGGFLSLDMHDLDFCDLRLDGVVQQDGRSYDSVSSRINQPDITNIMLGIGGSVSVEKIQSKVKLWFFTVKDEELFGSFENIKGSYFGQYSGNNKDNRFFTVKGDVIKDENNECLDRLKDPDSEFSMRLQSYRYIVDGSGGSDVFVIHHQQSLLRGGTGSDSYILHSYTESTVIDNSARDDNLDVLQLGVPFEKIQCVTHELNLIVKYCGTRKVTLENFFDEPTYFNQHLSFLSSDGIEFQPMKGSNICHVTGIDKSRAKERVSVDLTFSEYAQVKTVTGSPFDDVIIGNDYDNIIFGGNGSDLLIGGPGTDRYMIYKGSGCDTIDIEWENNSMDIVVFEAKYGNIELAANGDNLRVFDKTDQENTCFEIKNWNEELVDQLVVASTDRNSKASSMLTFQIKKNFGNGLWAKYPLLLDFSNSEDNCTTDLSINGLDQVITVKDSDFDDNIVGNAGANFLSCSGGNDQLSGGQNSDSYVIKEECSSVVIDNYDSEHEQDDILFLDFSFVDVKIQRSDNDIQLYLTNEQSPLVTVKNWFVSEDYRHLKVQTIDGIISNLPDDEVESGAMDALEIMRKPQKNAPDGAIRGFEHCPSGYRSYDLSKDPWRHVEVFQSRSGDCNYNISGNELNNFIDPGRGHRRGYQAMSGSNGSDLYVIGLGYGMGNKIYNYATDLQIDTIKLGFPFSALKIYSSGETDLILRSDEVYPDGVTIVNFLISEEYQRLNVHTSDGVVFMLIPEYPYKKILMVNFSDSTSDVNIGSSDEISTSEFIKGAIEHENNIQGSIETLNIDTGNENDRIKASDIGVEINSYGGGDVIYGGAGSDYINSGSGDDVIYANAGDDYVYASKGADFIDGGAGFDTVDFSGNGFTQTGVYVNLETGIGRFADAEGDSYVSVEDVYGSVYDDELIGNDDDNLIYGSSGDDVIHATGAGWDRLIGDEGSDIYNISLQHGNKDIQFYASPNASSITDHDTIYVSGTMENICIFTEETSLFLVDQKTFYSLSIQNWERNSESDSYDLYLNDSHISMDTVAGAPNSADVIEDLKHTSISISDTTSEHATVSVMLNETNIVRYTQVKIGFKIDKINSDHYYSKRYTFPEQACDAISDSERIECATSDNSQDACELLGCCYQKSNPDLMSCFRSARRQMNITELNNGEKYHLRLSFEMCSLLYQTFSLPDEVFVTAPTNPQTANAIVTSKGVTIDWLQPDENSDPNVALYQYNIYLYDSEGEYLKTYEKIQFEHRRGRHVAYTLNDTVADRSYKVAVRSVFEGKEGSGYAPMVDFFTSILCQFENWPENRFVINVTKKTVTYGCKQHYYMKNELYLNNEQYTTSCGKEVPSCLPVPCPVIPPVENGFINMSDDTRSAEITCAEGYELDSTEINIFHMNFQCIDGAWQPALPACRRIASCANPPLIPNANLTLEGINRQLREEAVAEYECQYGYKMEGNPEITCLHGSWTVPPVCSTMQCVNPTQEFYDSASFQYVNGSEIILERFVHGEQVRILCTKGFYQKDTYRKYDPYLKSKNLENVLRILDERSVYECDAGMWNPRLQSDACLPLITETGFTMGISSITISTAHAVTNNISAEYIDYFGHEFCHNHGSEYDGYKENTVFCSHENRLYGGPDEYQGFLQIWSHERWETVCLESEHEAEFVCNAFGYGKYTSTIVPQASNQPCNKVLKCDKNSDCKIEPSQPSTCRNMVRCRQMCDDVSDVFEGHGCVGTMLEGERCYQYCKYNGSPGWRTCTSRGKLSKYGISCYADPCKVDKCGKEEVCVRDRRTFKCKKPKKCIIGFWC